MMPELHAGHNHSQPTATARNMRRVLLRALTLAMVIGILCLTPSVRSWIRRDNIAALAASLGALGPAVLIAVGAIGPIFFVPRAPICIVAGLLYGVTRGSLVGIIAGTVGSIVHYYLSMGLLARSAERLTPKRWQRSITTLQSHPFRALLLLRLFPLSNASLVNMISGLLRLPFRTYVAATTLGTLPITVIYALWGKTASDPSRTHILMSTALLLALTLITALLPRIRGFQR